MASLHKNIQLMLEFLRLLGPTLFLLCINDLMISVILLSMLTILSKCDQDSDLCKQLKLASEL